MMVLSRAFYKKDQIVITDRDIFLYLLEFRATRKDLAKEYWVVYNAVTKEITMTWLKVPYASTNRRGQ